jgi:hypothetical protein
MGGGLMQLVAYGAQDIYLTGNPQITFFKVVYRRHTNFSMEAIEQTWNGSADYGGRVTATISRNGDLVHRMYLEYLPSGNEVGICANPGTALIDEVELEIGGQKIDKHYGHWLETWYELTEPNSVGVAPINAAPVVATSINTAFTKFQQMTTAGGVRGAAGAQHGRRFIPFQFWFNRNPGLALPLIALQYHEVKVILTFSTAALTGGAAAFGTENSLWCDYIYLDTDERRRFAQVSHEYLIEQLQYQEFSTDTTFDINFNHPVKELIWTGGVAGLDIDNGPSTPIAFANPDVNWKLKLNGHDRFAARNTTYFTRAQIHAHHSGFGSVNAIDAIAVYSFALKPEEHQPSGTCNFSRIDNAQLTVTATTPIKLYAVNYNVLRIMSGMGGLAYSN